MNQGHSEIAMSGTRPWSEKRPLYTYRSDWLYRRMTAAEDGDETMTAN